MQYIAATVDLFHALVMATWILGLPLLFWHKYPKLSRWYSIYCLVFIIINQLSQHYLGCCVLTTISNYFWTLGVGEHQAPSEWFSVRLSSLIFGLTPSHRGIKIATEILIAIAAVGGLYSAFRQSKSK